VEEFVEVADGSLAILYVSLKVGSMVKMAYLGFIKAII
jgi:hypothetical protein